MSRSRVLNAAVYFAVAVAWGCTPSQVRYLPTLAPSTATGPVQATLFLVGDAGEINEHSTAVLAHVRQNVDSVVTAAPARPVVVAFLGDNIYEVGARAESEATDLAILDAQVAALADHGTVRGVFIPGNHDWSKGGADDQGRLAVRMLQGWITRLARGQRVELMPADACPGPSGLDVGESIHLVFVDTEWLLRRPEDDCGGVGDFYERLRRELAGNRDKRIVVLSHHPLASGGVHGGHVALFENGPLVYYLVRKAGARVQDLASPRYADMIRDLELAFAESGVRPLLHAGGHDHALQVIRLSGPGRPAYQLVSGAGSRSTNSRRIEGTRYATNGYGYMRLDFHPEGARLTVYARALEGGDVRPVFACMLSEDAPDGECPEPPLVEDER